MNFHKMLFKVFIFLFAFMFHVLLSIWSTNKNMLHSQVVKLTTTLVRCPLRGMVKKLLNSYTFEQYRRHSLPTVSRWIWDTFQIFRVFSCNLSRNINLLFVNSEYQLFFRPIPNVTMKLNKLFKSNEKKKKSHIFCTYPFLKVAKVTKI